MAFGYGGIQQGGGAEEVFEKLPRSVLDMPVGRCLEERKMEEHLD